MYAVRLSRVWEPVRRWDEFRRRQVAALEESNRLAASQLERDAAGKAPAAEGAPIEPSPLSTQFGELGRPLNRHSPSYLGFFGATGAVVAVSLWRALGELATTVTILLIAVFLTLALNPIVEMLTRRGLRRGGAVAVVYLALLGVVGVVVAIVTPPVVTEAGALAQRAPGYLDAVLRHPWVRDLDAHYHVIEKFQEEFNRRVTDQEFLSGVLGGILGAGKVVASGVFQTLTVLILTLYFLSAWPRMKSALYGVIPASRRPRVVSLSEEIQRRVGMYAIGQVSIAALNSVMSWLMMTIIGIPYAAVLAVAVGFLGLVPMVGATLGATVVCVVAFFTAPKLALIAAIYYLVYQQIENYIIAPRVMQRTVSVPGAVTVVAALSGGTLLGMLGALLAIPVAAALLLLFDEVLLPRQERQ